MRRFLFLISAVAFYFVGIPICRADNFFSEVSPDQVHAQLVSQELDKLESSGNTHFVPPPPAPPIIQPHSHIVPDRNEFDFSSELYWAKFDQPKNLYQKGFMSGYNAQFTRRISDNPNSIINMFRLQGQWASGKFKTQPVDQGPSGIKNNTFDLKAVIGKDFYPLYFLRTTGYFGFGYRYLKDNAEGLNTNEGFFTLQGYNRFSHYCYLPLGADIVFQNDPSYTVESNLEYDYLIDGSQVDKLGVIPGYNTLVLNQRTGFGLKASLRLNLYFKYCTAFVEGFYRYWNIAKSADKPDPTDPSVSLNEPKNNTQEFGLRLGVQI